MGEYTAGVRWQRAGAAFVDNRYSRAHKWQFDGGAEIAASASPLAVPPPLSDPRGVDPEEAFVAALASCHMLWFLSIAAKEGLLVDAYTDDAMGYMEQNERGRLAMTRVILRPRIQFSMVPGPTAEQIRELHDRAHHECYLASSVLTAVTVEASEDMVGS